MSTLLLAFANSDTDRLKTLTDECTGVTNALRKREADGDFAVVPRETAKREQIIADIQSREGDLCLFLYSGHAGRDRLQLEDGIGHSSGIAALLKRCVNLKVVVLNGCSTAGQVDQLHQAGVPIVIATSAKVDDVTATQFSIAFFSNLATNRLPIREAFNRAVDAARVYGKLVEVVAVRSLDTEPDLDTEKPLWGLYYQKDYESLLNSWYLPARSLTVEEGANVNQKIRRALERIAQRYGITATPNAVMERMPFVINEPIRWLTANKAATQEESQFYDTPSWERFQMLLYAYRAIVNLTTFALLAEAWGRSLKDGSVQPLSNKCRDLIKSTLFSATVSDLQLSNLTLLRALIESFRSLIEESVKDSKSSFLTDLKPLMNALNVQNVRDVLDDLESKIANQTTLRPGFAQPENALRLCLEAENSFAVVLLVFGFWAKYSLTSIKNIELLKYRHLKAPSYLHQLVPLQIGYTIAKEKDLRYRIDIALESTSIILHPHGHWQEGGLNLSPFLVDKNALLQVAKSDVYYLLSYAHSQGRQLFYRKVSSYEAVWTVSPIRRAVGADEYSLDEDDEAEDTIASNYHTLLIDQLAAFAGSVLNQSLETL